jgi:hypothetical protein
MYLLVVWIGVSSPSEVKIALRQENRPLLRTKPAAPCLGKNLLRSKEIVRENTGPQQSATNKKKIHTHLKNYGIENNRTGPTTTTLITCELIQ